MVKKILIGVSVFIALIIVALATAPVIFRDEIKQAIDDQLEANVNAEVLYDIDNFSLSFFSNFPNLTAGITDLGVIGREPFAGEVLFAVNEFEIELNIWKLLSSQMSVQGIYLDRPKIFIKVLEDGSANYDIAISSEETVEEPDSQESDDFTFAIEHWSITDGHIIYDDATLPTYVELTDFNHTGSGNFSLSVFDLKTSTEAYLARIVYDGDSYLEKRSADLDIVINMDLDNMKFTFRENIISINDFSFGLDGWLAMPGDDIDMDLTFDSKENTFKSLISLIPAMYAKDFEDLKTSGSIAFDGAIKGTYNDTQMPSYNINLAVADGMFQYPALPQSVNNVQLAMNITSKDGNVDNTSIDISRFHLEFGKEPMDGHFRLGNLVTYPIDLDFNTSINLANFNELIPMAGLDIAGSIEAHIKAVGEYDSVKSTIPKIDALVSYNNGVIRYSEAPAPIKNINMVVSLNNQTGKLNDTKFLIPEFKFDLDESPFFGDLLVENFDNIRWQTELNGDLNFDKLFPVIDKLYPLPGTTLSGNIKTKIRSEGQMQDVENENYKALKTSGEAVFTNFIYTDSVYMPQGFAITSGTFSFNPNQIIVSNLATKTGSSDFTFNGTISNYIAYIFNDEVVTGQLGMNSNKINVNEFMTDSEEEEAPEEESQGYAVIEVPGNIDFVFNAKIGEIKYDNLTMNDARGNIIVRNGEVRLDNLFTRTLGGSITFNGSYNTADIKKPAYNMALDVKAVEIGKAYKAFSIIKMLAPIASDVTGQASSVFKMNGILKEDMMPDMAALSGQGNINVLDASLKDSKFATGLTSFLKKGEQQSLTLKDIKMKVSISNGKLKVQPFDLKLNNTAANIGGSTGLDGSIDYTVKMDVPAGQLGAQANALLGSLTGNENKSETIKLNIGVGGSYDNPKFNLLGSDGATTITGTAAQKASDLVKQNTGVDVPVTKEELNQEAIAKAREEADKLLAEAQKQADQVKLEAAKGAERLRAEAKIQSDKLIEEAGNNILKKKAAEIAGKKLIDEADKQAVKLEEEGNNKADLIMSKAQEKADAIIREAENK